MQRFLLPCAVALITCAPYALAQSNAGVEPYLIGQLSPLSPEVLYKGWRARPLLRQEVTSGSGKIGAVRDIIVDKDGKIVALIVEGGGVLGIPDAIYRVPWSNVNLTPGRRGIRADLSSGERPQFALFPGTPGVPKLPREFRISEVIGDYVRLQTGHGYGSVSDAVFTRDGRVVAVLVSRDKAAGGGTFAFPFSGYSGKWDPGMSYFGLPFVTDDQAAAVALRIEPRGFTGEAM